MKLKFYFMDWDDNILHLDTKLLIEYNNGAEWKQIEVSTSKYATIRSHPNYRLPLHENGTIDYDTAFSNFRDVDGRDCVFLNDCIEAIDNKKYGPSFEALKKCMISGFHLFIVTARGHEPKTIRKAIEYIINNFTEAEKSEMMLNLSKFKDIYNKEYIGEMLENVFDGVIEEYLDECQYIGVTSPSFFNSIKPNEIPDVSYTIDQTEIGKYIAINRYVDKCITNGHKLGDELRGISIGFSDDDLKNLEIVKKSFTELKKKHQHVKFVVYDTSKNNDGTKNYNKIVI